MSSLNRRWFALLLVLALWAGVLTACQPPASVPSTPKMTEPLASTPPAQTDHVVISEIMGGVKGNNNHDFIELYNLGPEPVDLQGWSLWYRLSDDEKPQLVVRWQHSAFIPPGGHYLLVHTGEDFGLAADAFFETPFAPARGGLQLRRTDGSPVDSLAWGNGPASFAEGQPAPSMRNGQSLERLPGDAQGNGQDTDDNAHDFTVRDTPQPENSGSPLLAAFALPAQLRLSVAAQVNPGTDFTLEATLTADKPLGEVTVWLPLPPEVAYPPKGIQLEPNTPVEVDDKTHRIRWTPDLSATSTATLQMTFQAPWTYTTLVFNGAYAQAEGRYAFAVPLPVEVGGGAIPIAVARQLVGEEVVVEGVSTMYTGGYYAGSGNVKFYLQDETGGIQVQVFGGEGAVNVPIGARVRVRGEIGKYRGAVQIVPKEVPADIEILAPPGGEEPQPLIVSLAQADDPALEGQLIQVEGTLVNIRESTYNYTLDLVDEAGHALSVYVDKNTRITMEDFQGGEQARLTGILEERDGVRYLYPRRQSDLERIYPPVVMLDLNAPIQVQPGETFTVTLTAINHTEQDLTQVRIILPVPQGVGVAALYDNGQVQNGTIVWSLARLQANGGTAQVSVDLQARQPVGDHFVLAGAQITADQWPEPATAPTRFVFLGDTVPIWAIQGEGFHSPYAGETMSTQGVVTGVFPGLHGFWIQNPNPDDDPHTSEGLFITLPELAKPKVQPGDLVEVTGTVREAWQQTTIQVASSNNVQVLAEAQPTPTPVPLDPPRDPDASLAYYEALEGMLVTVPVEAIAVAPTNRYGETVVVRADRYTTPHLHRGEPNGHAIIVDDGSYGSFNYAEGMLYRAATGDTLTNLFGPLAYTYGRHKIEPLVTPQVEPTEHQVAQLDPVPNDDLRVMTWNVENLFDDREPHPTSSPPMPLPKEYDTALAKVANTILWAGCPTVVAVQEVENIHVLEDIAAQSALSTCPYQPVLIEGHDSRGIDVGYLVRRDQAEILETEQFDAPEGITPRPPLMLHLRLHGPNGPFEVYLLNNHFYSMAGGVEATEPRRIAQARWNLQVMEQIRQRDPQARFIVLGDLNAYYDSAPIEVFRQAGMHHVMEGMGPEERYSYIYQGETQTLDHILVSPDLMNLLNRVQVLHLDADYPPPPKEDTTPIRKSDHDPVIADFHLP